MTSETFETTETSEKTNGAKPKGPSHLEKKHREWLAKGGKNPPAKEAQALLKRFAEARARLENLERQVAETRTVLGTVSVECIEAFGKRSIELGGVVYDPMSREEHLYYRPRGSRDEDILRFDPRK